MAKPQLKHTGKIYNYKWDETLNWTTWHHAQRGGFVNLTWNQATVNEKGSLLQKHQLEFKFTQRRRQRKGSRDEDGGQLSCN